MADSTGDVLRLPRLSRVTFTVPVEGITPVIPHRWSEKALAMMREKQSGKTARPKREPKDPKREAHDACYWVSDGQPGMPATAFKSALASAARHFEGVTIVMLKELLHVEGVGDDQLVPIYGESRIREDTPRNATGVVDLRYRYAFYPWTAELHITTLEGRIDPESLLALVDAAGLGGVGDWRPSAPKSKTGTFGTFRVPDTAELGVKR